MALTLKSNRHLRINKSDATMVVFITAAVFLVVFTAIASRALLSQRAYQSRVIVEKEKAKAQLKTNDQEIEKLKAQYKVFTSTPQNLLGGNPAGTGDKDGDNARIILNALPSKYDFPALATSLAKIGKPFNATSTGSDEELAQSKNVEQQSPVAVPMPFSMSIPSSSYANTIKFLVTLQSSIRPISIETMTLTVGSDKQLTVSVTAKTYYQPGKTFTITTKDIK